MRGGNSKLGALLAALVALALVVAGGALGATGDLTFAQCLDDEDTNLEGASCTNAPGLDGAISVAVSGDGKSLYAASQDDDAIVRFNRNTTTGALTFAQCFDDEDTGGEGASCTDAPGLGGARSVAVSGDGKSLYAASASDGAIVRFNRTTTGALTFAECFDDEDTDSEATSCTNAPALDGANSVALSGDGKSLYASSSDDAIVRFDRNTTTGVLTFAQCFDDEDTGTGGASCTNAPGLRGAHSVALSGDGKSLYAASFTDGIARFNRNTTGVLTFAECFDDEDTNPEAASCANTPGLGGARSVAVSGDGKSLYASSNSDDTIVRFNRNTTTGDIGFSQCFDDEDSGTEGAKCTNAPGLDGARSVAVSGDGRSLYAASQDDDAIVRLNRNAATGALSFAQCLDDEDTNLEGAKCTNAPGLDSPHWVAVSGDGKSVYGASTGDDAIVRFNLEPPPSNAFSFGKLKRNKRKGTATLPVTVPGPGGLVLAGKGLVKRARQVSAAGRVKLKVRPKGSKKRKLNRTGKVKVKARVTYTPSGGEPRTKVKRIKLIKQQR